MNGPEAALFRAQEGRDAWVTAWLEERNIGSEVITEWFDRIERAMVWWCGGWKGCLRKIESRAGFESEREALYRPLSTNERVGGRLVDQTVTTMHARAIQSGHPQADITLSGFR